MSENFENHRLRSILWIVKQLEEGPLSLMELNKRWVRDVGISGGEEIERRTFSNYIHAIDDLLGISIECNRKNKYRYEIVGRERSSLSKWMLTNFEQQLALERGFVLKDRILMEEPPRGHEFLRMLVDAMTTSRMVRFVFKDFNDDEPFEVEGAPYALKVFQQRWYVVINDDFGCTPFSLDRITEMELMDKSFEMDPGFDAKEYFNYCFGVRVNETAKPSKVLLKIAAIQRDYIRHLKLHHTQKELETYEDYSIFELTVVPTIELTMKLLSMGYLVEVLAPEQLRKTMEIESKRLYDVYH